MVIVGARNDQGAGRYFYVWKNNRLRLIRALAYKGTDATAGLMR